MLCPAVDRLELRSEGPHGNCCVAVGCSFAQALEEGLAGLAASSGASEEKELLGILTGERSTHHVEVRDPGDLVDAFAAGGASAAQNDLADQTRVLLCHHLRDHPSERETEQVNLVEAESADERDGVIGHRLDRGRRGPSGCTDASIVEGDHPAPRGDTVDHSRVPVVEDRGQVGEEHHRRTDIRPKFAIREVDAVRGVRAGDDGLPGGCAVTRVLWLGHAVRPSC